MEENCLISPYGYDGPCICMTKKRKFITIASSLTKVWDLDLITLFAMAFILFCNTATILLLELPIFAILTSVVDLVQVNMRHNKP